MILSWLYIKKMFVQNHQYLIESFHRWGYVPTKHKDATIFEKHLNPIKFGIHCIAPGEYSQMSTHAPGFHSLFRFFASSCIDQFSRKQHKLSKHLALTITRLHSPGIIFPFQSWHSGKEMVKVPYQKMCKGITSGLKYAIGFISSCIMILE